jgi:hypothetical protein
MPEDQSLVPMERIERKILLLRGHKVMLDADLAELYDVETGRLMEAVKRNLSRFPDDFMFQMSQEEVANLKSQIAISSWGGRRTRPYVFTEQGVSMLSSVLRSQRAVAVNVEIMRTFVRLRRMISSHEDLSRRLDELEQKYNGQFAQVFEAIRQLMLPPAKKKNPIGF